MQGTELTVIPQAGPLVAKFQSHQRSLQLMQYLINVEIAANTKNEKAIGKAKMELVIATGEMMPGGKPAFKELLKLPPIQVLHQQYGRKHMLKVLMLMVKDLCQSLNVVRNMDEGQMIEAAAYLLDECGDFRLEDYTMMFAMGKRGQLVKILDRVDLQVIGQMLEEYWHVRADAAQKIMADEDRDYKNPPPISKADISPNTVPVGNEQYGELAGAMIAWNENREKWEQELREEKSRVAAEKRREFEEFKMKRIEEYAKGEGLNMEEVLKIFSKDKKDK